MSPPPTVFATAVPNVNAATKLKNAAHATACIGERTLVDTTVAIEFAASCQPLEKSNAKAAAMMKKMKRTPPVIANVPEEPVRHS